MSSWTRRFILIPQLQAGPESVVSALTASGKEDEISLIVDQPKKDKRYRPYRDTLSRPIVGPPGSQQPSEKLFSAPRSAGSVRPRLYGEPEIPVAGNILVPSGGSRSGSRFSFNRRNETHINNEGPIDDTAGRSTFQAPGDAQFRQSPLTFGKSPDVLMANHSGIEHDTYLENSTMNLQGIITECKGGWSAPTPPGVTSQYPRGQYLGRPKFTSLKDGRLMATWLSTFLPPAMNRWIGEGKNLPGGLDQYPPTPPIINPSPSDYPRSIYTTVYKSFLDPNGMIWSKPEAINDIADPTRVDLPINGPSQATRGGYTTDSELRTVAGYGVFFDSVQFPDTGEIVSVWASNDLGLERVVGNPSFEDERTPESDFLKESSKCKGRHFYSSSSTDGGATFSVKSWSSGGNTSTSDIPGFTDQFDGSSCLAGAIELLDTGRLVVCVITRLAIYSLISDDRGSTWRASKVKEYRDGWLFAMNRATATETFLSEERGWPNNGKSGWMWADCDFTKTAEGTAVLAVCLSDDEVFFDFTHSPDDGLMHSHPDGITYPWWPSYDAGRWQNIRTPYHGMSTLIYSTSGGESYGAPVKISNWGYSFSKPAAVSRKGGDADDDPMILPTYVYSDGVDTSINEEHYYWFEQNPGAVGIAICMRPDGFIQVYLAVHNWGNALVYDGIASRTLSVDDLTGGQSSEEVVPNEWSQDLNRKLGNLNKQTNNAKQKSFSFMPVNMQFSRTISSGWAGSIGPPWQISTNEIFVDHNGDGTTTKITSVLYIVDYYSLDPDDPTLAYVNYPAPQDGEALLVGPEPDALWADHAGKLAVYDAANDEFTFHSLFPGDTYCLLYSSAYTIEDVNNPGTTLLVWSTVDFYVWGQGSDNNNGLGQRQSLNPWTDSSTPPKTFGGRYDNVPDPKLFFNGANSLAAIQWRGEVVVSVAHVDMQQCARPGPDDPFASTPKDEQWLPWDPNQEDWPASFLNDFGIAAPYCNKTYNSGQWSSALGFNGGWGLSDTPSPNTGAYKIKPYPARPVGQGYTAGSGLTYKSGWARSVAINVNPASGGTDISSISIYRTSYWQPLRENLPASLSIGRTSTSNPFGLYGGLIASKPFSYQGNQYITRAGMWFPATNGYPAPWSCGLPVTGGDYQSSPSWWVGGYEDSLSLSSPYGVSSVFGRAYNFCWDAQTPPEIGNNYAVSIWNAADSGLKVDAHLGNAELYDRTGDEPINEAGGGLVVNSPFTYSSGVLPHSCGANTFVMEADPAKPISNVSAYASHARFADRYYSRPYPPSANADPGNSLFGGVGLTSCVRIVAAPVPNIYAHSGMDTFTEADINQTAIRDMACVTLNLAKIDPNFSGAGATGIGWGIMMQADKNNRQTGVALIDMKGFTASEIDAQNHSLINEPVWIPWPDSYGDDEGVNSFKFLEILVSTQESRLSPYAIPQYGTDVKGVYLSAYVRLWDRYNDPDWLGSYTTIAHNYNLTLRTLGGVPEPAEYDSLKFGCRPGRNPYQDNNTKATCVFKSIHLARSDTEVFMGDGRTVSGYSDFEVDLPDTYDGFILSKAALGANIVETSADVLDGLDASGNVIYAAGFDGAGTCDPATLPVDDDRYVYPLGPPYLGRSGVGGGLALVDSGITNAMRPSLMTSSPLQWIERGAHIGWTGLGGMPGSYSYDSTSDFSVSNIMSGPTARMWKSTEGVAFNGAGSPPPSGGDSVNRIYTKQSTTITLDAYGEKGYATDGNYTVEVLDGNAVDRLFRPTGIAVFGRNFGSLKLTLTNDPDNLGDDPYQISFGLPFDGMSSVGRGYEVWDVLQYEPNKYTHLWFYSSVGRFPNTNSLPQLGPNTFSYVGDGNQSGSAVVIDTYKNSATPENDYAPWRPGQFRSSDNGPKFYLEITAGWFLDNTSSTAAQRDRARCIFGIVDNDATTLFLDSNPLNHFNRTPMAAPDLIFAEWHEGQWFNASIFSDRFGSQLNYTGAGLVRDGDLRGQGYRYAVVEIEGCTHFSEADKSNTIGRVVLGELVELTSPDFEWGWSISQESGTNLLTTEGGPRYSNVRHAPRRVFQVEHAAMLPADEPLEGVAMQPLRGTKPGQSFGGGTPPGRYAVKRSWQEVIDMIRRMDISNREVALFWEGELALDVMPLPDTRLPAGSPGSEDYLTLASPDNLLMVRLTQVGGATHDGYICRPVVDGNQIAPRPLMKITSMTFEEEF